MKYNNKSKNKSHLDLVLNEIRTYNKKHNTKYSYGEYTALVRMRKIRPNRNF